jgi:hypothetical protein
VQDHTAAQFEADVEVGMRAIAARRRRQAIDWSKIEEW